jgi:hypothetical protein
MHPAFPRIRVRLISVRITAIGLDVDGVAAVDEHGQVHFVVPGSDGAAYAALEGLLDGADMYEVL